MEIGAEKRREFTKAVVDMLSVNEHVEVVSFHSNTIDKGDWKAHVSPRLECNNGFLLSLYCCIASRVRSSLRYTQSWKRQRNVASPEEGPRIRSRKRNRHAALPVAGTHRSFADSRGQLGDSVCFLCGTLNHLFKISLHSLAKIPNEYSRKDSARL
jgi:hypothetical protein